jgi:hypothetical protein
MNFETRLLVFPNFLFSETYLSKLSISQNSGLSEGTLCFKNQFALLTIAVQWLEHFALLTIAVQWLEHFALLTIAVQWLEHFALLTIAVQWLEHFALLTIAVQ